MPDLRLDPSAVADLTAYLRDSRDGAWENLSTPEVDERTVRELLLGHLQKTETIEGSEARYERMDRDERLALLGERSIRKYGCASCHDIGGFEDVQPFAGELSHEGSKPTGLFDFGRVAEVPRTRLDWLRAKLRQPRIWDRGKEISKEYGELLRMPDFGMSKVEVDAVLGNILAFTEESRAASWETVERARGAVLAAGRRIVSSHNCRGCHVLEGKGQRAGAATEDAGMPAPNLDTEGARVQAQWLFRFLFDPGAVRLRPWLSMRMPSFGLDETQANILVSYFGALEGRQPFEVPSPVGAPRELAVGEVVFAVLQCGRCHPDAFQSRRGVPVDAAELAPPLRLAPQRLRFDWVVEWIVDPRAWVSDTRMPSLFTRMEDGSYRSEVALWIEAPIYDGQKRRLLASFASAEELGTYLGNAHRVGEAIRDYIWHAATEIPDAGAVR
jgi:hypothetical protein